MATAIDHLRAIKAAILHPIQHFKTDIDKTLAFRFLRLQQCGRGVKIFAPEQVAQELHRMKAPNLQVDYLTKGFGKVFIDMYLHDFSNGYLFLVIAPGGGSVKQLYFMISDDKDMGTPDKPQPFTASYAVRVMVWKGAEFEMIAFEDQQISREALAQYAM